jgi:hypothetical protein
MFSTSTLIRHIRDEYRAMPALKLTREQACRLWGVNGDTCDAAITALLQEGFLQETGTGKFVALPRQSATPARVVANTSGRLSGVRCPHCQKLNTIEAGSGEHPSAHGTFRCVACRRIISITTLSA